ncbi:hypothetical protein G7054_g12273 [Neopestalotiopsis clavispora]|nr:hypothetical protein G7054_g12273 [Neopestalotiopsis clavispora]
MNSIAQEQNHDLVAARLESLTNAEAEAADQLNNQFGKVLGHLKARATIAANTDKNVVAVLSELRTANSHISSVQAEIASLPRVYASLDPYRHNTVFIEDALGSTIPVPLDINPSWETIQSMVRDQFKHRPGQELVMGKKYVLQDIVTGTDLDSKAEFHQSVRPGHKVAMAMIFGGMWLKGNGAGVESSCPKCSQKLPFDTPGSDTICPNNQCNFIFRGVLDISAWDNDAVDEWVSHPKAAQYSTRNFGYEDLSELIAKRETLDGPNIFKRVRYISRWEDFEDSRGNLTATIDGIRFWGFGSNGWADQAFWNILTLTAVELAWRDWCGHRPGPDTSLDAYVIVLTVRFAGYTKSTSVPIITVLVKHQRYRQRVQDAMRSLEFIRAGRIQVLVAKYESSSDPLFPENIANPPAFEEAVKARRKREGFGL